MKMISRRKWIAAGAGVSGIAAATHLAGRHGLIPPDASGLYGCGHTLTFAAHRLLTGDAKAREFRPDQISASPHPKGRPPAGDEFPRLQAGGFRDWRLSIDGMVARPASLSLDQLKSYPSRSQITQMICEEGWSYIAQWTGVPLSHLLEITGAQSQAKYAVYTTMDKRIEAIDMDDARHSQTLITYGMNGADLPVGYGGPLRIRVPRQLGYKSRKFLTTISLTDRLDGVRLGTKYSWYAGI